MRVAIVGGGIGGLAAAISVQKYAPGRTLRVYERDVHQHSRPQGYTISINQRGMNALGRLGLATAVAEHARQPLSFHIMKYDGRSLVQLAPQDKGPGRVYPVQRQVLRDMLVNMIADSADVIRWDSKIGGYTEGADGITLDVNGKPEGPYDIVLGADGLHSAIRKQLIADPLLSLGMVSFGGVSSSLITDPIFASNSSFFLGRGASFFSTVTADLSEVNFAFAFRPSSRLPQPDQPIDLEALNAELEARLTRQAWYAPIVSIVRQELAAGRLRVRHLCDRARLPEWAAKGITLLGDAAHPMSPYRGEGANTALADGAAFGIVLGQNGLQADWRTALRQYEKSMRLIGNEAAARSRSSAKFFHADSLLGTWARDGVLRITAASVAIAAKTRK